MILVPCRVGVDVLLDEPLESAERFELQCAAVDERCVRLSGVGGRENPDRLEQLGLALCEVVAQVFFEARPGCSEACGFEFFAQPVAAACERSM
jgi:hypothetical protein